MSNENILYLKFKDALNPLEFDLNQNTVFFGDNGKGKTRILKTINSLYKLDAQMRINSLSQIIDGMNLEDLKIDGVSYNVLLRDNEDFRKKHINSISKYVRNHKRYFDQIYLSLKSINSYFIKFDIELNYSVESPFKFVNKLHTFERKFDQIINNEYRSYTKFSSVEHLRDFFVDLINTINMIRKELHYYDFDRHIISLSSSNINKNITEDLKLITKLSEILLDKFFMESTLWEDKKLSESMNTVREKIFANLSSKSSYYISSDNIDITSINKKVTLLINNINNEIQSWYWHHFDEEMPDSIYKNRTMLENKIINFNKIMKKYGEIEIVININNEISFIKQNNDIEFDKLSSGERKLSFLFLEILFNEVDIYLIDEPELSVSLNFQNKLISDIHSLLEDKILFIATHAPFIFNDFKNIEGNTTKEVN